MLVRFDVEYDKVDVKMASVKKDFHLRKGMGDYYEVLSWIG